MKNNMINPKNEKTSKKKLRTQIAEYQERIERLDKKALEEEAKVRYEAASPKKWSGYAKSYQAAKAKQAALLSKLSPELKHLDEIKGDTISLSLARLLLNQSLLKEVAQDEWGKSPSDDPDFYNSVAFVSPSQVPMEPQFQAAWDQAQQD
jgi:hypothetical protein